MNIHIDFRHIMESSLEQQAQENNCQTKWTNKLSGMKQKVKIYKTSWDKNKPRFDCDKTENSTNENGSKNV